MVGEGQPQNIGQEQKIPPDVVPLQELKRQEKNQGDEEKIEAVDLVRGGRRPPDGGKSGHEGQKPGGGFLFPIRFGLKAG